MITKKDQRLGKSIKKLRRSQKLTQEELANKVRVTPKYIQFIESGSRKPSLRLLQRLSRVFEVKVKDIFPY